MSAQTSWNDAPLSALCRAVGGGTPPRGRSNYWQGQIPWASVKDFSDDSIHLRATEEHISEEGLLNSASNLIPPNTPLVCTRMAVGRCALSTVPTAINQDVKALIDLSGVEPEFLTRVLALRRRELDRVAIGSTVRGVSTGQLLGLRLSYPGFDEQARIVAVLDTIDVAIEQTRALVAKLEQVRAGLLHDMVARGVDGNRERRSRAAPWPTISLGQLATVVAGVTLGRSVDGHNTVELPYLRVANVQDGYLDLSDIKTVRIYDSELARYALEPGDVLMNEGGDADKLGRGAVWEGQLSPCLHQNHVFRVRTDRHRLNPYFLALLCASGHGKRFFLQNSKQSTNLASINSTQIKAFPVLLPALSEQDNIVSRMNDFDSALETERDELVKLMALRQGLSQDLLTGRIRVPAELELV